METEAFKAKSIKHTIQACLTYSFTVREIVFITAAICCMTSLITPPIALLMGIVFAQIIGHPYLQLNHKATHILLQVSVVGLGFGMNFTNAVHAGKEGFLFTVGSISLTLLAGYFLSRIFKIEKKLGFLITAGTAICGGSAIAAIAPVIKAGDKQVSVALGTIFILNALALFVFPLTGHLLQLSPEKFGLWCAVAIHDTSSVVGAAARYGGNALEIATTVKLARALWIIPVALAASFFFKNKGGKIKLPWFILLFVIAVLVNTNIPAIQVFSNFIVRLSKSGLTLTLFLIGSGLTRTVLDAVGWKPFFQAIILWLFIASSSLWVILMLPR